MKIRIASKPLTNLQQKAHNIRPLAELVEAPPALLALLEKRIPTRQEFAPVALASETTCYGGAALMGACGAITSAPAGQRNETLNRESMRTYQLVAGGEIALADADLNLQAATCWGRK